MKHSRRSPRTLLKYALIGVVLVFIGARLVFVIGTSCKSDRVVVDPKNPRGPQYAYRHDELELLSLAANNIMEMEQSKQYDQIYERYASTPLRNSVSRRQFLKMANCAELYLGGINSFDRRYLAFQRKNEKQGTLDTLTREVMRSEGKMLERLDFVFEGVDTRLNAIYWYTQEKDFLKCIDDVNTEYALKRKRKRKPKAQPPAETATQTATPPAAQEPKQEDSKQADAPSHTPTETATPTQPEPTGAGAAPQEPDETTPQGPVGIDD